MQLREIKELIRVFDKSGLTKLDIEEGDFAISMDKNISTQTVSVAPAQVSAPLSPAVSETVSNEATTNEINTASLISNDTINAPMVGTFYAASAPGAPAFVKEGDRVRKGQTVCILEAMKIMNEVEAEFDCIIEKILVQDASPVEFDMPLFEVKKI